LTALTDGGRVGGGTPMAPRHTPPPSTPSGAADRARRPSLERTPGIVDPHGSRMALASQRCWYGSLLTHSVRRGCVFCRLATSLASRDTDSIPRVSPPYPKEGGYVSPPLGPRTPARNSANRCPAKWSSLPHLGNRLTCPLHHPVLAALGPWQRDFCRIDAPTFKDAPRSVHREFDNCPISV